MCDACLHDVCECYCGPMVEAETPQEPLEEALAWFEDGPASNLELIAKNCSQVARCLVEGWSLFQRVDGKPLTREDCAAALEIVGATHKRASPVNPYLVQVFWEIDSSG